MTDKVIEFPKSKVVREIPEEIHKERQAKADMKQADTIVDEVAGLMITELDNYFVDDVMYSNTEIVSLSVILKLINGCI